MNPVYTAISQFWQKHGSRPRFRKFNEFLFDCSTHGLGINNYDDSGNSGEVYFLKEQLPQYMPDGAGTVIDVGANEGHYSQFIRKHYPNAKIIACEPNPAVYARCLDLVGAQDVTCLNVGLGSEQSRLRFYDRHDRDGASSHGSLYQGVIEELHGASSVELEVDITTLDAVVEEQGLDHIHFVKIDTEGHELEVLRGAQKTIASGQVDLFLIEFNEMNVISRVFYRDLAEVLSDYVGYRLLTKGAYRLRKGALGQELFGFQNLVFVHKRFKPDKHMRPKEN